MEETKKFNLNSTDIFFKAYDNRKFLIIITAIVAIISVIVSLTITPKYKSSVVLFTAPSTSIAQSLISTNTYKAASVFGEEEEVEKVLQVLNSDEVMERLSNKFNLRQHYKIDTTETTANSRLADTYRGNISFKRTEFMAVEISVLDESPDTAAQIANECAMLIDTVLNRMEKARAMEALTIVREEYETKVNQMKILDDSLKLIMLKGIYDYESQSEVYNNAYAEAIAKGNMVGAKKLEDKLQILAKYGSSYVSVRDLLTYETEQLSLLKQKLKEATVDANQVLTHIFVVNKATVPDKKHSPKRMLIVLVSTISAFIFSFIGLIFVDLLKTAKNTK